MGDHTRHFRPQEAKGLLADAVTLVIALC
jgi:hypothetical protein